MTTDHLKCRFCSFTTKKDYFSRKLGDVQRSMNFAIKVLEEAKDLKKPE